MANFNRSSLVLSVNRALWGEVTHTMRMVTARVHGGKFQLRVVFDGEIAPADRQSAARIGEKALTGDFLELKLDSEAMRIDAPEPLSVEEGWAPIYRRWED